MFQDGLMGIGARTPGSVGYRGVSVGYRGVSVVGRVVVVGVVLSLILGLSGCSFFLPMIAPTRPYMSFYVVNRDGHYFVGDRCAISLIEGGVLLTEQGESKEFDEAIWHVVSDSTVQEFEIYALDQPGVTVVFDDGSHPVSTRVLISVVSSKGYDSGWWLTLEEIDTLFTATRAETWDEFWAIDKREFGC